ncbi:hypothetical protein B0J11DRAFT_595245 [Dendryphion nanum]|uniref:DUF5071 domain-containing protein n=1 Tax=Dendryphion nanum TaxID=256645 RepID=A0A9P9IAH6_9PLEO|nr:hypothetical protein B0J11DRAFT_595245 [Dendryphion nanum]
MSTHPSTSANTTLLPSNKHDHASLSHLSTLPASEWIDLVLYIGPFPGVYPDNESRGLLTWLQDVNWPIATPVAKLLLSVMNREESGEEVEKESKGDAMVVVEAVRRVLGESDDWQWIYNILSSIVMQIRDRVWVRRVLGREMEALRLRVPGREEGDWGFEGVVAEILGEAE